ncbi:MAG: hypothetical protein KME45_00325 [Stenomitos rutilans HA7619-LM2]|jgi:hypothetical protein|nr:hypothetical protein [Stenomitos rutilans HA7619-LM2]
MEPLVEWVNDSVTHAGQGFDALRLCLTHPTNNFVYLLIQEAAVIQEA